MIALKTSAGSGVGPKSPEMSQGGAFSTEKQTILLPVIPRRFLRSQHGSEQHPFIGRLTTKMRSSQRHNATACRAPCANDHSHLFETQRKSGLSARSTRRVRIRIKSMALQITVLREQMSAHSCGGALLMSGRSRRWLYPRGWNCVFVGVKL